MTIQYMPGTSVIILDPIARPAGVGVIDKYIFNERAYQVWWTYEQTGETEMIKVPE